ncbi:hypothetical protein SSX86_029710 [Deinandra increscens subsp. villosa]|uniref:MYND-type domain-containing protein n=1 Tax=Deinandra increscens subsp. villosa TaxID=3103831 RepID=A0AAP0CB07_9ASTR
MRIEYEEEFDAEEHTPIKIGLKSKSPKHEWSLLPSKAGGTPIWLNPIDLPSGGSCLCGICARPLQFLLQINAPLSGDDESESTYHRVLFVFMCTSMSCLLEDQVEQRKEKGSRSIKVFRCQGNNRFYSSVRDKPAAPLCSWCGTWRGDKVCSDSKRARYCSKIHQALHWISTQKTQCRMIHPSEDIPKAASNDAWPEFEITCVHESAFETQMPNASINVSALRGDTEDERDAISWAYYTRRLYRHRAQVLRYSRDSTCEPLWVMSRGRPSRAAIPKCSSCGSDRAFEFQIMRRLLHLIKMENDSTSLDWATIVVYTCQASCDGSRSYEEEFPWVQLMSYA